MSMSRSASMYRSPYIYKPPPPKINYPFLFSCFKDWTCSYLLDSKFLAISVLILGVAVLVTIGMIIAPFWFQLVLDPVQGTFGSEPVMRELTIDSGIFYMRASEFDNLNFISRFTNRDVLPKILQAGQLFSVLGACLLVACFGGGFLLMCRQFSSPTAIIILAGGVTLGAVCEILVILACVIVFAQSSCDPYDGSNCDYSSNMAWRMLPIYEPRYYRAEPHTTPYVKPNWAFYIACVGAALSIAAAVVLWFETLLTHRNLGKIRYQQLKQVRDPHEKDFNPYSGRKYVYQPLVQHGPNTYGMQPIVHAGTYEGMVLSEPPQSAGYIPPAQPGGYIPPPQMPYRPPSPRVTVRGGPPSTVSNSSDGRGGGYVSREIDL